MEIKRSGSQPSAKGPAEWFTGTVRIDPLFDAPAPARAAGASVTFEPGARTAWHTHPLGQTLIVTCGMGRTQRWGGPEVSSPRSSPASISSSPSRSYSCTFPRHFWTRPLERRNTPALDMYGQVIY